VVLHNVGSAYAGYEACVYNRPLTERILTLSGEGMGKPANLRVRIGTPAAELLAHCGFDAERTRKLLVGGPMMGLPQKDADFVITKGTTAVIALTDAWDRPHGPCIRCARCVKGCPSGLVPCELSILGEADRLLDMAGVNVLDCIECGVCTYVCPAKRPIVQWIRIGKGAVLKDRAARKESPAS
jgi:electron transport complex protein RnfC